MNVYEFCGLCTERMAPVRIYDLNPEYADDVFDGDMNDAALSKYGSCEVCSFDLTEDGLTINVDTSDM